MGLLRYRVEHFGALIWAPGIVHTCKHLTLPDGPASLHHSTQSMSLFGHGGFNSQQRRMLFIYGTTPSAFAVHSSTFRIVFTVACMPVYLCDCEKNKTFFSLNVLRLGVLILLQAKLNQIIFLSERA